jgi:hypothetical protein
MKKDNKTHTSNGLELSDLFIGEDNKLSMSFGSSELEIVGVTSTPFGDGWNGKYK